MWRTLLLGFAGFASAQEADDDEVVVNDVPENKIPSPQELLKMLNSMDLSDEEKNKLREDIMNAQGGEFGSNMETNVSSVFLSQTILLLLLLSLISSIFVFFGYKLYKSLSERERKREEKKKMKQLKKKK